MEKKSFPTMTNGGLAEAGVTLGKASILYWETTVTIVKTADLVMLAM